MRITVTTPVRSQDDPDEGLTLLKLRHPRPHTVGDEQSKGSMYIHYPADSSPKYCDPAKVPVPFAPCWILIFHSASKSNSGEVSEWFTKSPGGRSPGRRTGTSLCYAAPARACAMRFWTRAARPRRGEGRDSPSNEHAERADVEIVSEQISL